MIGEISQLALLRELQPVAEVNLSRHLVDSVSWDPSDYVSSNEGYETSSSGLDYYRFARPKLSETARAALITSLLAEDNLPLNQRDLSGQVSIDDAWGAWVEQWTGEENRHGDALRDYLVGAGAVDSVSLQRVRMERMSVGIGSPMEGLNLLHSLIHITFEELSTAVTHRNTGIACNDPVADRLLSRMAADEQMHMLFYRNITAAALDIAPTQTIRAITEVVMNFQMPGVGRGGSARNAMLIARDGIYDLRQHLDSVLLPTLREWDIFDRSDLGDDGKRSRDQLVEFLQDTELSARAFELKQSRVQAILVEERLRAS